MATRTTTFSAHTASALFLSANLESLLASPLCSDAALLVPTTTSPSPIQLPVHRCLLAARSPFFLSLFETDPRPGAVFDVRELVPEVEVWWDALMVVLRYVYSAKVEWSATSRVCADGECGHGGCRPVVDFLLEVLYAAFVFGIEELVGVFECFPRRGSGRKSECYRALDPERCHLLDILDRVEEDDMLVVLWVANLCKKYCEKLVSRCIDIVICSTLDVVTLEKFLPQDIVKQITNSRSEMGLLGPDSFGYPDKHVRRIHQALDSDDMELVTMLLEENQTSLDDAYALHYAVAHCDSGIATQILDLGLAEVNHKNPRGYSVLHVAAVRREPKLMVLLLTKGARPSDTTPDGKKPIQISRRLTKLADYNRPTEQGTPTHKDRLCIEILEISETTNPLVGEAAVSLAIAGEDMRTKLLYLEKRVKLASQFFPMEAKIAMSNAKVDGTLEFTEEMEFSISSGSQNSAVDDLNETPFSVNEERLSRMRALSKTVELGRRFFPRCAQVIDKIIDENPKDFVFDGDEADDEKLRKRKRYEELISKAFDEDKEELDRSTLSSCSSSTASPNSKMARISN